MALSFKKKFGKNFEPFFQVSNVTIGDSIWVLGIIMILLNCKSPLFWAIFGAICPRSYQVKYFRETEPNLGKIKILSPHQNRINRM